MRDMVNSWEHHIARFRFPQCLTLRDKREETILFFVNLFFPKDTWDAPVLCLSCQGTCYPLTFEQRRFYGQLSNHMLIETLTSFCRIRLNPFCFVILEKNKKSDWAILWSLWRPTFSVTHSKPKMSRIKKSHHKFFWNRARNHVLWKECSQKSMDYQ